MTKIPRVAYTLELKLEALRRIRHRAVPSKVAREIGVPEQSIRNWAKVQAAGILGGAEHGRPITSGSMEISRLPAEMEVAQRPPRTLRGSRCEVRVH